MAGTIHSFRHLKSASFPPALQGEMLWGYIFQARQISFPERKLIDLNELMQAAKQRQDPTAFVAYQSIQERSLRAMSMPGPRKGKPLTEQAIKLLIHEEIKDRKESNEYMAPSQDSYANNHYIIKLLTKLLRS